MKNTLFFLCCLLFSSSVSAQWEIQSTPSNRLFAITFTNATTGYCYGYNGLLKTTDAGATWDVIPSAPTGFYISFPSDEVGYITSGHDIYKTTDHGSTWSVIYTIPSDHNQALGPIFFTSTDIGYMVVSVQEGSGECLIYKTINGGSAWAEQASFVMPVLLGMTFTNDDTGFIAGYNGRVIKTSDAGAHWTSQQVGSETFYAIDFPTESIGYAAGYSNFFGSEIFKTTDGGLTWESQPSGGTFNKAIHGVHFYSATAGYAVGEEGRIITTTDGGTTWNVSASGTSNTLYGVHFLDETTGFAVGTDIILKKSDQIITSITDDTNFSWNLSPNPAGNKVTINTNRGSNENYNLSLQTIDGQELLAKTINLNTPYDVDLQTVTNGIYLLTLHNETERIVKKIVVQK